MGVLEQISQMKNQGMGDEEIVSSLQEQGVSPKTINDALSQADIKKAVSAEGYDQQDMGGVPTPNPEQMRNPHSPTRQEISGDVYAPQATQQPQQAYSSEEYYPQQNYDQYGGYSGGLDSSTIIEIAEQVFSEKIQKVEKQIKEVIEFKTISESTLSNLSERVKRIESMIDKLQVGILERVGSYGKNVENLKKELSMVQDSFGKMVNPLLDSRNKKVIPKKTSLIKPRRTKKVSKK